MTVTDADRQAAASVAVLVEMRELILAGRADHHAEPWTRHREAAEAPLRAEVERLREAVAASNAAIAEYYRYWTGGETRGSYDGKPEREGLWRAMYKTRAALEPKP